MKFLLSLFVLAALVSCTTVQNEEPEKPTNIIFLIGDGMGLSAVSTGQYYGSQPSNFNRFKQIALINTSSASHKVTDSAASGTAMAAGKKTYNGAIGVDTAKNSIPNIVEIVSELGWSTGLVSSSSITHATPASFFAHVEQRGMQEEIAAQLLDSEIDFFAGGGIDFFGRRSDSLNLFPQAEEAGFFVDTISLAESASLSAENKYGFLLAGNGLPSMLEGRGDFLPEATALAIDYLSAKQDGFFLMVEGSQVDWASHANESERVIAEMHDFEKVIATAMDFAEQDGNTLVVVTADHETGGFTLSSSPDRKINPTFATGGHSATLIPVFAYGPGSEKFEGIFQNTALFHKMLESIEVAAE